MRKSLIKKILLGKKHICEPWRDTLCLYHTQLSLTYSYGEWYFYDNDKSFLLKDYRKKWWVE